MNRKDKFLKHVNDKHGDRKAEQVLEQSKVDFVARANWRCGTCGEEVGVWDERCRHVIGHFEDEVERGRKGRVVSEEVEEEGDGLVGDDGGGGDGSVAASLESGGTD